MDNKDIDLVYLWVDGNDPKWQKKKSIFTGKVSMHECNECYAIFKVVNQS